GTSRRGRRSDRRAASGGPLPDHDRVRAPRVGVLRAALARRTAREMETLRDPHRMPDGRRSRGRLADVPLPELRVGRRGGPRFESKGGRGDVLNLLISAGEASGDLHGARLLAALRRRRPELTAFGMGGGRLAAAGLERLARSEDLSVMGFAEVLERLPSV